MSLTRGSGPFGARPSGRFSAELRAPRPLLYVEAYVPRVRALIAGQTLVDSSAALLVHESGRLPVFWFPSESLRHDLVEVAGEATPVDGYGRVRRGDVRVGERSAPGAVRVLERPEDGAPVPAGAVWLDWHAMDEWFAEDEQLFGHARDPYTRIDVWRTTRRVRVLCAGEVLADSRRARMLVETSLAPRFYLPPQDVRLELLVPSPRRTRCAYKGSASYWHVRLGDRLEQDLVWSYPAPQHDAEPVRDLLCFFDDRVELELEGA